MSTDGQLGVGPITDRDRAGPVPLPGDVTAIAVAAGLMHSVALSSEGEVYTWGWNGWGQLVSAIARTATRRCG